MKQTSQLMLVVFSLQITSNWAAAELVSRLVPPKPATITKPSYESQLTLKFRDDLKVRAAGGNLTSAVGADLTNVTAVQAQYGLSFEQLIDLPQEDLDFIEIRASNRSGIARIDLV